MFRKKTVSRFPHELTIFFETLAPPRKLWLRPTVVLNQRTSAQPNGRMTASTPQMLHSQPIKWRSLLARRDDEAWLGFTTIHEPAIYRMTVRRGMRDADARQVVQEFLPSIASAISRFDRNHSGSFHGWLNWITRNATIDRIRAIGSRKESVDASWVARQLDATTGCQRLQDEFEQDLEPDAVPADASPVKAPRQDDETPGTRIEETNQRRSWPTVITVDLDQEDPGRGWSRLPQCSAPSPQTIWRQSIPVTSAPDNSSSKAMAY